MKSTIVVYGSSTGTCEDIANKIANKLGVDVMDVTKFSAETVAQYDNLLLGTSTWGAGELQDDWFDGIKVLEQADLSDKTVALFGCGDAASYGDTFCGAMAELYNAVKPGGATLIGFVPTDGYTFDDSEAAIDNQFVGLALDEQNESDQTDDRIDGWLNQIKPNL